MSAPASRRIVDVRARLMPPAYIARGRRLPSLNNDNAAKMRQLHPKRISQFAAIPLPDTEGSLREIASGLAVFTNCGDK